MEIRREPARRVTFRLVAIVAIPREPIVEKLREHTPRRGLPAARRHRPDRVIDRQIGQRARRTHVLRADQIVRRWPLLQDGIRQRRLRGESDARERVLSGKRIVGEMIRQRLVQKTAEGGGGREHAVGGRERQQAVAIHRFERHIQRAPGRRDHAGQEEGREIIRHHHGRVIRQLLQQAFPLT